MIADFEDAKKMPIEIAGQTFSYNPSALTIDLEDYNPIHNIRNYKDIEEIKQVEAPIIRRLIADYEQLKKNVDDYPTISKTLKDSYNTEKIKARSRKEGEKGKK